MVKKKVRKKTPGMSPEELEAFSAEVTEVKQMVLELFQALELSPGVGMSALASALLESSVNWRMRGMPDETRAELARVGNVLKMVSEEPVETLIARAVMESDTIIPTSRM